MSIWQVTGDENQAIVSALQKHWASHQLKPRSLAKAAEANVQADLDYYRLTRSFFETTNEDERIRFSGCAVRGDNQ